VIGFWAAGFIPIAFVDRDHFAGLAGDAAIGEEIGRVGKDEVDGIFWNGGKDIEAVAEIDAEVMFGVLEGGSGETARHELSIKERSMPNGSDR
jgi:hypothetical protein